MLDFLLRISSLILRSLILSNFIIFFFIQLQFFGREDNKIRGRTSSSKWSQFNCVVIIVNSLRWFATTLLSDIFRLKRCLIRWTLFVADDFSYMSDNIFNIFSVVVAFPAWNEMFLNKDKCTAVIAFLSNNFYTFSFISPSLVSNGWYISLS